jgi:hypothetical protein
MINIDSLSRLANLIFEATDISIASKIVAEGRALVLLINKLDRLPARVHRDVLDGLELVVKHVLPSVRGVPIVPISALTVRWDELLLLSMISHFERFPVCMISRSLHFGLDFKHTRRGLLRATISRPSFRPCWRNSIAGIRSFRPTSMSACDSLLD